MRVRYIFALLLSAATATGNPAAAQTPQHKISIPSGSLQSALTAFSRQARVSVGYIGRLPQVRVKGFSATMDARAALQKIASSSGLVVRQVGPNAYRLEATSTATEHNLPQRLEPSRPPREPALDVQDIIVTATKRETDIFFLPLSISTAGANVPQGQSGLPTTNAVVANTTGITSTNMGPGRNRLFIRGVADSPFNGPSQATVGIFLNEARVNFDAPDPDLRLVDIQRTEVIKGPQGALYGTGALGGVYRIVPHKPEFGSFESLASAEIGATANGGLNAAAHISSNIPVLENLAGRIVAYGERTSGWIDDSGRQKTNINDVTVKGARASIRWEPGDFEINALFTGQATGAKDSQYASVDQGTYVRRTAFAEPHRTDFYGGQISIAHEIGDLDALATSAFTHHHLKTSFDASLSASRLQRPAPLLYNEVRGQDIISNELRLADSVGSFQWLLGLKQLSARSDLEWGVGDGSDTAGTEAYDKRYNEYAIFGDASLKLASRLKLMLGARVFREETEEFESVTDETVVTKLLRVNPTAALSWRVNANTNVWLNYSTATRPGGINPSATDEPFSFTADNLESIELGFRRRDLFRRLEIEGAIYRLNWKNIQSDILLDSGLIGTLNVGRAHNMGGELLIRWDDSRFFAEAGVTAQIGDLYSTNTVLGTIEDARLPTIPRLRGHLRIEAPVQIAALDARVGAMARYTGTTHLSFDPRLDRRTGSFAVMDMYAQADALGVNWALICNNVFNSKADSFSFGNPFSVTTIHQRTPIRPRTISFKIAWVF